MLPWNAGRARTGKFESNGRQGAMHVTLGQSGISKSTISPSHPRRQAVGDSFARHQLLQDRAERVATLPQRHGRCAGNAETSAMTQTAMALKRLQRLP
jgi:hypothetical protein